MLQRQIQEQDKKIEELEKLQNGRNSSSKSKLGSPPKFHGSKKEIPRDFLFAMKNYLEACGEPKARWVQVTSTYLHDAASSWYQHREGVRMLTGLPDTWEDFEKNFLYRFQPVDANVVFRDRLASIKQKGSVLDYNHYFTNVISHITDISEVESIDRYTRGLSRELFKEVKIREPKTLPEAMHIASTHDSVRRQADYASRSQFGGGPEYWAQFAAPPFEYPRGPFRDAAHFQGPAPMEINNAHVFRNQGPSNYKSKGQDNFRPRSSFFNNSYQNRPADARHSKSDWRPNPSSPNNHKKSDFRQPRRQD